MISTADSDAGAMCPGIAPLITVRNAERASVDRQEVAPRLRLSLVCRTWPDDGLDDPLRPVGLGWLRRVALPSRATLKNCRDPVIFAVAGSGALHDLRLRRTSN